MDGHNLFMTRTTYRAVRAEYAVALAACIALVVAHLGAVNWWAFAVLFAYIDVIGYWPGAIAFRRAHHGPIPRVYYRLYNATHSMLSAAAVAGVWWAVAGPGWALLALPIHLCGDRAVFGNFLKPFAVSFEPATHPAYQEFVNRYDQPDQHPAPDALLAV